MPDYKIRPITLADSPIIVRHRNQMFKDMGSGTEETRANMDIHFENWLQQNFDKKRYFGWFAHIDKTVIAGAGVALFDITSRPDIPQGQTHYVPYVVNVYVEPDYRKQGIAKLLLQTAISWCRQQGYRQLKLHASVMGRGLYEKLGFQQSNEMYLNL